MNVMNQLKMAWPLEKKKAKKKLELALINTIQPEMGGKNTATHTRCFQNRPV